MAFRPGESVQGRELVMLLTKRDEGGEVTGLIQKRRPLVMTPNDPGKLGCVLADAVCVEAGLLGKTNLANNMLDAFEDELAAKTWLRGECLRLIDEMDRRMSEVTASGKTWSEAFGDSEKGGD